MAKENPGDMKPQEDSAEEQAHQYKFMGTKTSKPITRLLRPDVSPAAAPPAPETPPAPQPEPPESPAAVPALESSKSVPRKGRPARARSGGGEMNTARLGVKEGFEKHTYQVRLDYVEALDKISYQERTDTYQVLDRALAKYLSSKEAREILEQVDEDGRYPGYEERKKGKAGRKPTY